MNSNSRVFLPLNLEYNTTLKTSINELLLLGTIRNRSSNFMSNLNLS